MRSNFCRLVLEFIDCIIDCTLFYPSRLTRCLYHANNFIVLWRC